MPTPITDKIRTQLHVSVPADFNGYAMVGRTALTIPASEVQVGDILLLDAYVVRINGIQPRPFLVGGPGGEALHLQGAVNTVRFPHEIVRVIRPTDEDVLP